MTSASHHPALLEFAELDPMEAPSWESFYTGLLAGIAAVGIVVAAT